MDTRWKAFERRCAERMGGRRRPVTGIDRGDGDAFTSMFELQCKLRIGQPDYLKRWLRDIVAAAKTRNRVGVVVWKEPGEHGARGVGDDNALVVMRWADFVDLHGDPRKEPNGRVPDSDAVSPEPASD